MKGSLKVIGLALILSLAVSLIHAAPAETEVPTETAESGSKAESSSASQASSEQVPVPNAADTRADPPAGTGGSGTVAVSKPTATVGTFFDNIFNIPTSVLRAVNQFLNNNIKIGQAQSSKAAAAAPAAPAAAGPLAPAAPSTPAATSPPASTDAQTETPTGTPTGSTPAAAGGAPNKPAARSTFFDNIFNIPISAINSVNSLITGRKFGENGEKSPSNGHS